MYHPRTNRTRALASTGIAVVLAAVTVGAASATTEPPPVSEPAVSEPAVSEPAVTEPTAVTEPAAVSGAPDASAAPDAAAGVLAETTYSFADGDYQWITESGSVPRAGGDLELAAGAVTLLATTTGVVGVSGGDGVVAEVAEGAAVARAEDDTTVIGSIDAAFGSFTTIDIEPGAATDGGAAFAPGAGERAVTLTSTTIEPGATLDLSAEGADFVYVVVLRGVVDASDGSELVPHGAIAWSADAGPLTLNPRSPNVAAQLLVVTVAPAT